MKEAVFGVQILLAILLMGAILLQARGAGLGHAWGGQGEFYRSKRGLEKILLRATIFLAILFFIWSVIVSII